MELFISLAIVVLFPLSMYLLGSTKGNDALEEAQVLNYLADGKPHCVYGDLDKFSGVRHSHIWVVLDRLERKGLVYRWQESNASGQRVMYAAPANPV